MIKEILNEITKKTIHIIILILLLLYTILEINLSQRFALMTLIGILILFIIFEYFRIELDLQVPFFQRLIRPKEYSSMYSGVFFLAAAIISLAVFDFKIALAALFMTIIGDVSAAIIGKRYGKTLIFRNKTTIGAVTELIANLVVATAILIMTTNIYIIIAMALTATIVETLVDELDDNLIVPLFAGFIGQMLTLIF